MKKQVLIVFGGRSAEHEISLLSARNVASAVDRKVYDLHLVGISKEGTWYSFPDESIFLEAKALTDGQLPKSAAPCCLLNLKGRPHLHWLDNSKSIAVDIAFPVLHGTFGEDGCIQGLFKMMNLAFVGCGVFGSSAGMDKEVMKRIFKEAQIPTAKYTLLTPENPRTYAEIVKELGSPFFIKPANMGSSVGVHKIKSAEDFSRSIKDSFLYDHKVLAEEFVQGREIECAVLGHNKNPRASVCGEVIPTHEFYSYQAKYLDDNGAALRIPADLPPPVQKKIQEIAQKTFQVMGCEGLTRVDFFLKSNGDALVNEINTIPGFTKISMYPKMWEASGLGYTPLISELLKLGFETFQLESTLNTQFPDAR